MVGLISCSTLTSRLWPVFFFRSGICTMYQPTGMSPPESSPSWLTFWHQSTQGPKLSRYLVSVHVTSSYTRRREGRKLWLEPLPGLYALGQFWKELYDRNLDLSASLFFLHFRPVTTRQRQGRSAEMATLRLHRRTEEPTSIDERRRKKVRFFSHLRPPKRRRWVFSEMRRLAG